MKLIGFFNRDGGTFRTTDMEAYENRAEAVFREAGHDFNAIVFSGKEIVPAMERAARRDDIDGIVAGGGDGTISAAASIAWKNGIALGVVPAGTMNLFARSLRVPLDIWMALETLAFGEVDHVDIASANGRPFIHQFSAGLHARMVRYRNSYTYRSRFGKIGASARAALGVVFNPPEFEVEFAAGGVYERRRVSAVSISNNPFGQNALLYADCLTSGELGFYTAKPLKPIGVARLAVDLLRGKVRENADVMVMHPAEVHLHFPKLPSKANCVMDGELRPLERDVTLKLHPGELKVLVRQGLAAQVDEAERREIAP
ncbi:MULTISPECIES: diacylglycerol kinase family protein [unclassified Rhizobium]|uniref:diacylglycerol/lipid kinase family protein n=1 Tax=unclassified Rhizobium TaxID=2613769 RepID=UPI00160C6869|nr:MULTISPECIES: diacylglycerol kinase family protein [unclassified Rhizobium]MBB3539705.1 diacylglycerol kinase family enzyme [Rhizobium sp. BK399]MCS3739287.1 diacylglycerol kinase family enzyme [Rhizobium sp. BK661]MCS4090388.1 diacylglycerol kinase family enzyme [Rhizobium sp. BK176]